MSRRLLVLLTSLLVHCQTAENIQPKANGVTIKITGRDVCNINQETLFGPALQASLEFKNDNFRGCECTFVLLMNNTYDHIVLYLDSRLKKDEEVTIITGDTTVEFNKNSREDECIYLKGPLNIVYKSCQNKGDLKLNAVWAAANGCPRQQCYQCPMTRCYKHHDVEHGKLYINEEFHVSDDFKGKNCAAGGLAPGWMAFIVLAVITVLLALVGFCVHRRKKAKKAAAASTVPIASFFPSYPVITPDFEGSHSKGVDVSKSVFTTGGDMPIDSSNAYARFETLPTDVKQ